MGNINEKAVNSASQDWRGKGKKQQREKGDMKLNGSGKKWLHETKKILNKSVVMEKIGHNSAKEENNRQISVECLFSNPKRSTG